MTNAIEDSLRWNIERLPTELRLLLLEYIVIGHHKDLGCREMERDKVQKKNLFIILKFSSPFADVAPIIEGRYDSLTKYHRIFLTFHTSFSKYMTGPYFCKLENFNKMEAVEKAVRRKSPTINHMINRYSNNKEWHLENIDIMVISIKMDVVELSLKHYITSCYHKQKSLSARVEKSKAGNYVVTCRLRCCENVFLNGVLQRCNRDCEKFKEFSIAVAERTSNT